MLEKEKVGKMIVMQRKAMGMTQKQLGEVLNVSYQAVSRWELGLSLPTVEMLYDIAKVLDVTVDLHLNGSAVDNRDICYKDTGLDTVRLYSLKEQLQTQATKGGSILYSHYTAPVFFNMDITQMQEPVYVMATHVPGSKARFAREYGFDQEICKDLVARAINNILQYGADPVVLQAHTTCGNNDRAQLFAMGMALKEVCEKNGTDFAGLEVSCQPVNYLPKEYELSAALVGIAEREALLIREQISEGDVIIGIATKGLDATCFPFIRVMLDRNPELAYKHIDEGHSFMEEILQPNEAYTKEVKKLRHAGIVHGIVRVSNSILNCLMYGVLPDGLGAEIDLSLIRILPVYRFLTGLDMMGKKFFPYRFAFGIGMLVIVSQADKEQAIKIISQSHECYVLGKIERDTIHKDEKIWTRGELQW